MSNSINTRQHSDEVSLWRAVILQATLDCLTQSKRGEDVAARKNAKNWFDIQNEDFLTVCSFAQMNPEYVLRKVNASLVNQSKWRRRCDIGKGMQFCI